MSKALIIGISLLYLCGLFGLAWLAERQAKKGQSWMHNPYIYALALGVYCTAWTFYGSVGRAATGGMSFLPIFLGPTIIAPLWMLILRKIAVISKHQRITSIADFISSRYGKSTTLGMVASLVAVIGVIPYISIQLKAIGNSFDVLTGQDPSGDWPFYQDPALVVTVFLALFTLLFGTRHLDPNERHEGMMAAIAFESLFKLIAFLTVGLFVTFGLYRGFGDLFQQGMADSLVRALFQFETTGMSGWEWFWLTALSMFALLLLPRQFHVAVVEHTRLDHIRRAAWLFPLYLLLINIFVLPIAVGGLLQFPGGSVDPDTFVIQLPQQLDQPALALFAALGGFSAASSMVIVAVIALSIMISNQLLLPLLFKPGVGQINQQTNLYSALLSIRRLSMVLVLLLAYGYYRLVARDYALVSIGLISFAAVAQFAPALIGGLYWKRATRAGALGGLLVGFTIWWFMLPLPTLLDVLPNPEINWPGQWTWQFAMGEAMESNDRIAQTTFWSLLANSAVFFTVSLYTRPSALELTQADLFVQIYKYAGDHQPREVIRRRARVQDIRLLLQRFLGPARTQLILNQYQQQTGITLHDRQIGEADLINRAETHLAGAIGASSAKIIMATITKDDPISLEEMFTILEQTQEIIQYSRALERKSEELEQTSRQLREANERLRELDTLKAEFIATVTHELRTPITSIKSLSKILLDHPELDKPRQKEFLDILVRESERVARLINQVLDIEQIDTDPESPHVPVDVREIAQGAFAGVRALMAEKRIEHQLQVPDYPVNVLGQSDHLTQVMVNLLSNAIKFAPAENGQITVRVWDSAAQVHLSVRDNGKGIPAEKQALIFEKFTQVSDQRSGKPPGSGLGLFITKRIVDNHRGEIRVDSQPGQGTTFQVDLPKFLVPVDAFSWGN